jgi:sugar diacid utilization regulator
VLGELRGIVDFVCEQLQRSVKLDDYPQMQVIAYSAEHGSTDDVWVDAIVHRRVSAAVRDWVGRYDLAALTEPLHIPGSAELKMSPRLCIPARCREKLMGHLWIVEGDVPATKAELEVATTAARDAAAVLYREHLLGELERGKERELLRDLLSEDRESRELAADELLRNKLLQKAGAVVVLVLRWTAGLDAQTEDLGQVSAARALEHARLSLSPRQSLQLLRPDHGVFLALTAGSGFADDTLLGLGDRLVNGLSAAAGKGVVGIGEQQACLPDAVISYRQAVQAAKVGALLPGFGPSVLWSRLGVYRTLASLASERLATEVLHPGLVRLFERKGEEWLVKTLECYLDNGGQAQIAAKQLNIHRAGFYYRLQRIEEIAGVDLRSGDDRLALHLGLKLARMSGIHPVQAHPAKSASSVKPGRLGIAKRIKRQPLLGAAGVSPPENNQPQ